MSTLLACVFSVFLLKSIQGENTPANTMCETFRDNALLTMGSSCWNLRSSTYRGKQKQKKHNFIEYIVNASTGESNFPSKFSDTFDWFYSGNPGGKWIPVTGNAHIGDMVLYQGELKPDRNRVKTKMFMVVKLGKNPVVLKDGAKVKKNGGITTNIWWDIRRAVKKTWSFCRDKSLNLPRIKPADPTPPCDPWVQDEGLMQKLNDRLPPYWSLLSISQKKGKDTPEVTIDHDFPVLQKHNIEKAMKVYRYVEEEVKIYCGPPYGTFKKIHKNVPLPDCPPEIGTLFTMFTDSGSSQQTEIFSELSPPSIYNPFASRTVFIVHGFRDSGNADWVVDIKDKFLDKFKTDINVITVDWEEGAKLTLNFDIYQEPMANTQVVAKQIELIIKLLTSATPSELRKVWCVGHSLGAHTCGKASSDLGKIGKITGLDPAGPSGILDIITGFNDVLEIDTSSHFGLHQDAAEYVEAIHTNSWFLGTPHRRGDVDIYVGSPENYGDDQPICTVEEVQDNKIILAGGLVLTVTTGFIGALVTLVGVGKNAIAAEICNHGIGRNYFNASFDNSACFEVFMKCPDEDNLNDESCPTNAVPHGIMGFNEGSELLSGVYVLNVGDASPFCIGSGSSDDVTSAPTQPPGLPEDITSAPTQSPGLPEDITVPPTQPPPLPDPSGDCVCIFNIPGVSLEVVDSPCGSTVITTVGLGDCHYKVGDTESCTEGFIPLDYTKIDKEGGGWVKDLFLSKSDDEFCTLLG